MAFSAWNYQARNRLVY